MKKLTSFALFCISLVFLTASLPAEDRASMSSPIIKATPEGVSFSAQFSSFSPTGDYRLGLGTSAGPVATAQFELLKSNQPMAKKVTVFEQGYTSNWWNINKVTVQGYVLGGADLPGKEEKLTLRVTIPKAEMEKIKKVYFLVARKYGPDTWYLEDGAEMDESYW